jgi:PAS domain S-box-containing protein
MTDAQSPCHGATVELSSGEYRNLVEGSSILLWRADATGECVYANGHWLGFTGRSMIQSSGHGWTESIHPDDLAESLKQYAEGFRTRETFEMEYRLRRHDGVYRWVHSCGVPVVGVDGSFSGFIGSCTDVTQRVEAQEALKTAHANEITTLKSYLPICASCKSIRDDEGRWNEVATYLLQHVGVVCSHGICPVCEEKFYATLPADEPAQA